MSLPVLLSSLICDDIMGDANLRKKGLTLAYSSTVIQSVPAAIGIMAETGSWMITFLFTQEEGERERERERERE